MPFTPTHILAVVPIGYAWSRSFPFSALVIGSMVPDFPMFFPAVSHYDITHSFAGIVTACIPIGLALWVFFQTMLKGALFELLPPLLQQRLIMYMTSSPVFRPRVLALAIMAIATGAMTHVVWDSFTHKRGLGVKVFPILQGVIPTIGGIDIHIYTLLQHVSTLVGFPILLVCFLKWFRTRHPQAIPVSVLPQHVRNFVLAALVGIPLSFGVLMTVQIATWPMDPIVLKRIVYTLITQTGGMFLVLLGCYGIVFYLFMLRQRDCSIEN